MRFGSLPSSLTRLDIYADSLQVLAYFFMLRLRFSYQNNVRAASFVGIDRPTAGTSGGNCIPLKKVSGRRCRHDRNSFFSPTHFGVALAFKLESPGPIIFRRKTIGLNGSIIEILEIPLDVCQTSRSGCCAADKQGRSVGNTGGLRHSAFEHRMKKSQWISIRPSNAIVTSSRECYSSFLG
jgi:hypothetical protein